MIVIPPGSTGYYRISFYPKSYIKPQQNKIARKMEFLVGGVKEVVTCLADLLSADVSLN